MNPRFKLFNEYEDLEPTLVTEQPIRAEYWPHWYERMCRKFGKSEVDQKFTLHDSIITNWAWEVKHES
jgi:hypothetical protein